jgi:uncharacterized phage protein gp47/JayE
VSELRFPTVDEIRAQILSDIRYGLAKIGITANVAKDSEYWHRAGAIAKRVSIAIANGKFALDAINPLRAKGQDLVDLAAVFGVTPRPAASAGGYLVVKVLKPATSVTITAGYACSSAAGVRYKVVTDTVCADGSAVQVVAIDKGKRTDLAAGAVVTWEQASIAFLDQKASVDPGGIDGGQETDSEEVLRQRLLRRLGFPGVGGNWAQVEEWAEKASAAIAFAAVYPAMRGPASYDIAVVGAASDQVLNATVQALASNAIVAEHPGHVSVNVTGITLQELDVVINLGLPLPKLAGGVGGGWVSLTPWPSTADPTVKGKITAVDTSQLTITVSSTSSDVPAVNQQIAIWDYKNKLMKSFTVTAVSGSSGAYVLTLDTSTSDMAFIEANMYVSPAAEKLQQYADAFVAAVAALGPGEKTDDVDLLRFARRKPGPDIDRPYNLTSRQLDAITKAFSEVSDASYAARYETATTNTRTSPSVPSVVSTSPRRLALKHLAFRAST